MSGDAARLSRSLSGYLCGTHSGALGRRRGDRLAPAEIGAVHATLPAPAATDPLPLGNVRWQPTRGAERLAGALARELDVPGVVDLILYGSQARHSTTGYSDVDAILVLTDAAAQDRATLRALRPRVLRAQRHVLDHQPMQHHGFEIATPRLLGDAGEALGLPVEAVGVTAGLLGRGVLATFAPVGGDASQTRFESMAGELERVPAWPRHPWPLHRVLSMYALLPALFLQALGQPVAKWQSFEIVCERLPAARRPFGTLRAIRDDWSNRRHACLRALLRASRNPWAAVDLWRRGRVTARTQPDQATLAELREVIGLMRAEVRG